MIEGTEEKISGTNDDATLSKHSSSKLGYFKDDFVGHFVLGRGKRMPPLINRGYYVRVNAFRSVIDQFLEAGGTQVISFGAGYDTNYFRLKERFLSGTSKLKCVKYFEFDFPHVVKHKSLVIKHTDALHKLLNDYKIEDNGDISSLDYSLMGVDLRDLADIEKLLIRNGVDFNSPALFLSECVLIYINPTDSGKLIEWTTRMFQQSVFIIYEQIHPHDAFGEVMINNLMSRGVPLSSIMEYPDLQSQRQRMMKFGYQHVVALDINQICNLMIDRNEIMR
eukprot:TRINITY_DN7166_c1_g2_i2.p1 TRINITY_DN7166_c1_g2~~TRINITY_DN7166_c1_g2_i2.p1  ORF type:complete len:279 (-),score=28.67 TRINITY_DN7166_c1_g2_i2:94-930(-)